MDPEATWDVAKFLTKAKAKQVTIIDTRDKVTYDKASVPGSIQITAASVFREHRIASSDMDLVFNMRDIDKKQPMIFVGDGCYVLKAMADNAETPKTHIFPGKMEDFVVEFEKPVEEKKEDANSKSVEAIFTALDTKKSGTVKVNDELVPYL